jgi:tetratricopeptide (TPR) repeat protein
MVVKRMQDLPTSEADQRQQLNEEARSHLRTAMRLGDEGAPIPALLADLYVMAGDPVNAEKYRRRHCELEPAADACITRALRQAQQLMQSGDVAAAQEAFARAHRAKPQDADLWLAEGSIWQKAGRNAEAEQAYREVLRLDPDSYAGHDNIAFVLFDLGRVEEAQGHFERALQLYPDSADALAGKAITLEVLGNHLAALRTYTLVVEQDRSYVDCHVMQEKFLWSDAACKAAQPLLEAVSREITPSPTQ